MVLTLPDLNSRELQKDLEVDINNLPGIKFVETSLMSKTLILKYDARKISPKSIDYILNKWGCSAEESYFRNVVSMK